MDKVITRIKEALEANDTGDLHNNLVDICDDDVMAPMVRVLGTHYGDAKEVVVAGEETASGNLHTLALEVQILLLKAIDQLVAGWG